MSEKLLRALLQGYYVPDMEYVFKAPDVCCAWWGVEAWFRHVKPYPLEMH